MYFKFNAFPRLKGKAAEVRHFGGGLMYAFETYMDTADPVHRMIHEALSASVTMEEVLDTCRTANHLGPVIGKHMIDAAFTLAQRVTQLRRHFHSIPGQPPLFRFTTKMHILLHIALLSPHIHPRHGWCWQGENFMQKAQCLIQSVFNGTPTTAVEPLAMVKYCRAFEFDLWRGC